MKILCRSCIFIHKLWRRVVYHHGRLEMNLCLHWHKHWQLIYAELRRAEVDCVQLFSRALIYYEGCVGWCVSGLCVKEPFPCHHRQPTSSRTAFYNFSYPPARRHCTFQCTTNTLFGMNQRWRWEWLRVNRTWVVLGESIRLTSRNIRKQSRMRKSGDSLTDGFRVFPTEWNRRNHSSAVNSLPITAPSLVWTSLFWHKHHCDCATVIHWAWNAFQIYY